MVAAGLGTLSQLVATLMLAVASGDHMRSPEHASEAIARVFPSGESSSRTLISMFGLLEAAVAIGLLLEVFVIGSPGIWTAFAVSLFSLFVIVNLWLSRTSGDCGCFATMPADAGLETTARAGLVLAGLIWALEAVPQPRYDILNGLQLAGISMAALAVGLCLVALPASRPAGRSSSFSTNLDMEGSR